MELFLLRHAKAERFTVSDEARTLTAEGREAAKRVGKFCKAQGVRPELILASPLTRAQETAQLVAAAWEGEVVTAEFAASGMSPSVALNHLQEYRRFRSVMLVGHEPDLSQLIAVLLGLRSSHAVEVGTATLIGIRLSSFHPGGGQLQFFVPTTLH